MKDENPKLRERSVNAVGRIGRGDEKLIIPHLNMLMKMRHDECENVRHAFIWACEKLDIFYEMIGDSSEKVRIEAPELFRVIGKRKPEYVKACLTELEWISKNDENPIVRIHTEGAVRITEKTMKKK